MGQSSLETKTADEFHCHDNLFHFLLSDKEFSNIKSVLQSF